MKKKAKKKVVRKPKEVELIDQQNYGQFQLVVAKTAMDDGHLTVMEVSSHGVLKCVSLWKLWETYRSSDMIEEKAKLVAEYKKEVLEATEGAVGAEIENMWIEIREHTRQLGCIPGSVFNEDDEEEEKKPKKWWQFRK